MSFATISIEELQEKRKPIIIDVREPHEFEEGHIPGADNVPLGSINEFDSENNEIYLVCRSGKRSARAADTLTEKGYNAVNVEGGMLEWDGPVSRN